MCPSPRRSSAPVVSLAAAAAITAAYKLHLSRDFLRGGSSASVEFAVAGQYDVAGQFAVAVEIAVAVGFAVAGEFSVAGEFAVVGEIAVAW